MIITVLYFKILLYLLSVLIENREPSSRMQTTDWKGKNMVEFLTCTWKLSEKRENTESDIITSRAAHRSEKLNRLSSVLFLLKSVFNII